jgi:hypothetical protein
MGLTGQEERACVHDSMRIGWGRGGGDDRGCQGRYITAAAKLMHPSICSARTLIDAKTKLLPLHTRAFAVCMPVYALRISEYNYLHTHTHTQTLIYIQIHIIE